jgi:hypothetical protein
MIKSILGKEFFYIDLIHIEDYDRVVYESETNYQNLSLFSLHVDHK